jgi:hypothetical protein
VRGTTVTDLFAPTSFALDVPSPRRRISAHETNHRDDDD